MQFDLVWFFVGLAIVALGVLILKYYNKLAEATRVMNYSKWQIAGVIVIAIGFFMALNIHTIIVNALVHLIIQK